MAKSTAKIIAIAAAEKLRNRKTPEPRVGSGLGFGGARVDPEGARWPGAFECFNRGLMFPIGAAEASVRRDGVVWGVFFADSYES